MKSFADFINETVATTKRQNLLHLQKMKPTEFIDFVNDTLKVHKGVLSNINVSLKADGFGARFGKDSNNEFFFETSRSGPIQKPGMFTSYVKSKNGDEIQLHRAALYDQLFDTFNQNEVIRNLPSNTKVICEILYNPMAVKTADSLTFVSVKYDKTKLGSLMTIIPFDVILADGGLHPQKQEILDYLYKSSNAEIKIINPTLASDDIDINAVVEPIAALDAYVKDVVQSRKHIDREKKAEYIELIQKVKDQLAAYILAHPGILNKDMLGPEIEGLVLQFGNHVVKVTTPEFKASKAK